MATKMAKKTAKKPAAKTTAKTTNTTKTTKTVSAVPTGFHTITPSIVCKDAAAAIAFYKKAFGATETMCMNCPSTNKVMHAEMKLGDSIFFLSDEMPAMGCMSTPTSLWCYVADCDAAYNKAIKAGATARSPMMDMFWGDRMGSIIDNQGNTWTFATHKQDLTPAQIAEGQTAWIAEMKAKMGGSCSASAESCS
jgi:uncharacterized glyoxalase superfamily protein PhnB